MLISFYNLFKKSHFLKTRKKIKSSNKRMGICNTNSISFFLMKAALRSEILFQENIVEQGKA